MAIKIFQNPPAPTAPTEPDFLQPHVSLISLSFERTLKAILLAAVPKKECAIREDDACCATFTKKVAKKYFAFVSYEKKRIALQKRYGIIAIVTTRLFLQNGGKRRSYAYYKT